MGRIIKVQSDTYVFANNNKNLTVKFRTKKEAIWLLNENLRLQLINFSEYRKCMLVLKNNNTIPCFYYSGESSFIREREDFEYEKLCDLVEKIFLAGYLLTSETCYPIFPLVSCVTRNDENQKDREIYYLVYDSYKIGITDQKKHFLDFKSKMITSIGEALLIIRQFKSDPITYRRLFGDICSIRFTFQEN